MTIDIIDLTDPQYADLSAVQLTMVRVAQAKKNTILAQAEKKRTELFYDFLERGLGRSSARTREEARITAEAEAEVETVKDDLLHQLAYETISNGGNENGPYRYPENPNYNLTYSQRFLIVREYYMGVEKDPEARLEAFRVDSLARAYLGEYYQTLYDLLASYVT